MECNLCLKRVLEINPGNPTALSETAKLRKAEKEYQARSKEMQKNMVKRLFPGGKEPANGGNASNGTEGTDAVQPTADGEAAGAEDGSPKSVASDSKSKNGSPKESQQSVTKPTAKAESSTSKDSGSKEPAAAARTDAATSTATATTSAPAYISMYNASSNIVLLLATSLVVVLISIYVAYFAKYQQ